MDIRTKPPIGCKPKFFAERERCLELIEAINRYTYACIIDPVVFEWISELRDRLRVMAFEKERKVESTSEGDNGDS